jgi:hypothetical protein
MAADLFIDVAEPEAIIAHSPWYPDLSSSPIKKQGFCNSGFCDAM